MVKIAQIMDKSHVLADEIPIFPVDSAGFSQVPGFPCCCAACVIAAVWAGPDHEDPNVAPR
jgi:hypothetical protein